MSSDKPAITEGATRELRGDITAKFVSAVAIGYALFQVYTAGAGPLPNMIQRALHLGFALVLCFMLYPARKRLCLHRPSWLDYVFSGLSVIVSGYVIVNYDRIMLTLPDATPLEFALGLITVGLVLEAGRRTIGPIVPGLAILVMAYSLFGSYLPGWWGTRSASPRFILENFYLGTTGIWGTLTGVSATVVAIFVIFGAILSASGGAKAFIDVALILGGRLCGGAGQVAVIGSALFGMISGSAISNVATTGSFTIPMMKGLKYRPELAGAVEAVASTGGQFMPPIMGAAAFLMAEILGVSYLKIIACAALPAVLYYVGVGTCLYFEAKKCSLMAAPEEAIPKASSLLKWSRIGPLLIPVGIILYFLLSGYSPSTAAFYATVASMIFYLSSAKNKSDLIIRIKTMFKGMESSGKALILVAAIIGCAQIIVTLVGLTAFGLKFSKAIILLGGNSLPLALFLSMVVCMILGMGVPTTAAYAVAASVIGPVLVGFIKEPIAAHLFILYFAALSAITPPVCTAVFVASAIAQSNWLKTGFEAVRLGSVGLIVPFMFIFSPSLLGMGEPANVVVAGITATLGVIQLAAGLMGYLFGPLNLFTRFLLVVGALCLIKPGLSTDFVGLSLLVGVALYQKIGSRRLFKSENKPKARNRSVL